MGRIRPPEKAILFIALLLSKEFTPVMMDQLRVKLLREFGEILYETPLREWNWTDYYKDEMGECLKRGFIFFKGIFDPSRLPDVKLKTNEMEEEFSANGKRKVNLDPGYITLSKVVLASTKNYCHRIYLGKGIYGEVTLYYSRHSFKPHLFTYRDYADPATVSIFNSVRETIKEILL